MYKLATRIFNIPEDRPQGGLVGVFALLTLVCIFAALRLDTLWIGLIPAVLGVVWLLFVDIRKVFFLMLGAIPVSTEVSLPGGLATDCGDTA